MMDRYKIFMRFYWDPLAAQYLQAEYAFTRLVSDVYQILVKLLRLTQMIIGLIKLGHY